MDSGRKIKLILSSCFVLFLVISSLIISVEREKKDTMGGEVEGVVDLYNIPKITSVAPVSVVNGEEYIYIVRMEDGDTEFKDLVLSMSEGPEWLSVEGDVVKGVARGVGTYKVILRVSDAENFSERKHYILVEEK